VATRAPTDTPVRRRDRLEPSVFRLPVERIREGYYSDVYFNRTVDVLRADQRHPHTLMQVFQKQQAVIGGMDEAIAIVKLCSEDFAQLRAFLGNENRAFERRSKGLAVLSSGFHILLGEMCGNPVLARILNQLVHRCVLIQSLYERESQSRICLVHEHAEIVDLMEKGKIRAAVAAMHHHLDHIETSLDYDQASGIDRRLALSIV